MDPTLSNDVNQVGTNTQQSVLPSQSNYLSPQQRMQMQRYASGLMTNQGQPPVNSWGQGLGEMARATIGGMMMNQASPMGGTTPVQPPGGSTPMQLPSGNNGIGDPTQLPSANGGSTPMNIFQGLFGGGNGATS